MVKQFTWPEGVDLEALEDAVAITSNSLSRRYSRYGVDGQDIRQELWLWSMHNTDHLVDWLAREDRTEQRMGWAALTKSLRRAGERYCRKEKAAVLGYKTRDEVFYDEAMLQDWLAVRENGVGVLLNTEFVGKIRSTKSANEGWNVEATTADLERALDQLDDRQRFIVTWLYGKQEKATKVGTALGISRQAVEQQAHRALRKMVDALGGRNPW